MMNRTDVVVEVVRCIAEIENRSPHDLEYSLHDYIDTSALKSLVESPQPDWELTFHVPDHTVSVRGNGEIEVDGELMREADLSSVIE